MRTRDGKPSDAKPWRTLLWIATAGLLFGLLGLGDIAEDTLRSTRNTLHWHKASGDIVIVKIDERALERVGRWPWPRRYFTQILDRLDKAGANRALFDFQFTERSDTAADDKLFADSLKRYGRATLAVGGREILNGQASGSAPRHPIFADSAALGSVAADYNWQNAVWSLPFSSSSSGRELPGFASILANRKGAPGTSFPIDYSIDPNSVPSISAASLLAGEYDPAMFKGRDVLIGTTAPVLGDTFFIPSTGRMGGVYVQALGAETLKSGNPVQLGWLPAYLAAIVVAFFALLRRQNAHVIASVAAAMLAALIGPTWLESNLIFIDVLPAVVVLIAVGGILVRRRFRKRGFVDPVSGLPNLTALKSHRGRDQALIVARILNYAEVVAALPANSEQQLVDQIVTRLSVGAHERTFFQGDDGIFAWFDEPGKPFGHHLEALHALFRTPVRVNGMSIDLSVSFGVEIGSGRSMANRLGSALLAAEEAAHDGLKWKYHDPDSLQDASWKLSMLSQLDDAVDRGEVWVAYQPKVDLKTRRIVGAEALARWTHPEKGPIAAAEFIAAAEQNDRIGKLTAFVLDEAIASAAGMCRGGRDFDMSVNLSGRLLSDKALVGRIAILLERHGLDAHHLTLELTETAALAGSGNALDMLMQLRELGVNISIDDYGTGLSTLDYLKKVPACEIKIDQSFVRGMVENRSERLMVASTIALAHSLGRRVVAEGVETRETLEILAEMECDVAQGFITGRPMALDSLRRRLASERRSKVA